MKKILKNNKGITLVALVVTIVVLLILAGVSINLVLGENGLISNAKEARDKTLESEKNEYEKLNTTSDYIKQTVGVTSLGITTDDYGKIVTNYGVAEKTWEIFYADSNNIYLITKENCESKKLSESLEENNEYTGTADFDGSETFKKKYPAIQAGWLNKIYTVFGDGTGNLNYKSGYDNMKCTEYLLDSSIWNENYKTDKADWAIGAPTLELLVASYGKYKNNEYQIPEPQGAGYAQVISTGLTSDLANGIYNPGYSYWLACPSNYETDYVRDISAVSFCVGNTRNNGTFAIRPIVCLNSSVTLIKNDDDSYSIK